MTLRPLARSIHRLTSSDALARLGALRGFRSLLSGYRWRQFLGKFLFYLILAELAYVFMFPLMYIISTSMKSNADLVDPTVVWIPRAVHWPNYELAMQVLGYWPSLRNSLLLSLVPAVGQTLSCAIAGYALARMRFPGRELIFGLVILVFLVPPQVFILPLFILFSRLKWLSTVFPIFVPSFVGHGLKGGLFVIIYRQFFRGQPWELEEAALVDGAGPFATFWRIMFPLAQPAMVVVFLFSFVWHWNDRLQTGSFLVQGGLKTLQLRLGTMTASLHTMGIIEEQWTEGMAMAAILLTILPVLIVYVFTQRNFVESISRTGLIE